jgi:hypothetical protein
VDITLSRELLFPFRPRRDGAMFDGYVSNLVADRFPLEELTVPTLVINARDIPSRRTGSPPRPRPGSPEPHSSRSRQAVTSSWGMTLTSGRRSGPLSASCPRHTRPPLRAPTGRLCRPVQHVMPTIRAMLTARMSSLEEVLPLGSVPYRGGASQGVLSWDPWITSSKEGPGLRSVVMLTNRSAPPATVTPVGSTPTCVAGGCVRFRGTRADRGRASRANARRSGRRNRRCCCA